MNANVVLNNEKNGIEIRFDGKPEAEVIASLKEYGFRWSGKQKMWYAKQSDETIKFANSISDGSISYTVKNKIEKHDNYNLWKMTRTNEIPNNFVLYKIYNTKEIAAIIRKHIKPRFPMCKFSVVSDHSSIHIDIISSPFEKDSDELNAIRDYVDAFAESYNYNNSDLMSDYFDVNFYLHVSISYNYEQVEMSEDIQAMVTLFANSKSEFEEAEAIRKQKEFEEHMKQAELDRIESEKREKQNRIDHQKIEDAVEIVNIDGGYFIENLLSPNANKCPTLSGIELQIENNEYDMVVCNVTREIHMTKEIYDLFKDMLLHDFSFLAGMGGSRTDDNRISDMTDYYHMTEEERATIEWYNIECVAIFCDGALKMVCDPQGYDYARYTFIPCDKTTRKDVHVIEQVITPEQLDEYKTIAEGLEDISANIIFENEWVGTWNTEHFNEYRKVIVKAIKANNITFNINVVRAISGESIDFKHAMYQILETPEDIREQFKSADFAAGEKITIIRFDDCLGGVRCNNCTFDYYEHSDWGGKNGVKIVVSVPNKRGKYYHILNGECLIIKGWIELPKSLFWEDVSSSTGLKCERTKYLSFDRKQFDVTLEYLCGTGADIVVNTYKPIFN